MRVQHGSILFCLQFVFNAVSNVGARWCFGSEKMDASRDYMFIEGSVVVEPDNGLWAKNFVVYTVRSSSLMCSKSSSRRV